MSGSSTTRTLEGSKSMIRIRASERLDLDGDEGRAGRRIDLREVHECRERGARDATDLRWREVADLGHLGRLQVGQVGVGRLVARHDRDAHVGPLGALREHEPRVEQGGEADRRQLQGPVVDDDARRSASPRRPGGRGRAVIAPRGPGPRAIAGSVEHRVRAQPTAAVALGVEQRPERPLELALDERPHDPARSTRLIWPFSSETTTTTASVCSVIPRAARWRVPKRSDWIDRLGQRQQRAGGERPARRG